MKTYIGKKQKNRGQSTAAGLAEQQYNSKSIFRFADNRPVTVIRRKLQGIIRNSPQVLQLKSYQAMADHSPRIINAGTITIQRMTGADGVDGHEEILNGTAANRGAACLKIAQYINLRMRYDGASHDKASALGTYNAGNLYVKSNYTNAATQASSVETWSEMTAAGGGYVKRVRIIENAVTLMDRVMNDPHPTAFNTALINDAGAGGTHQYGALHGLQGADSAALNIDNATEHAADNITKIAGEGARFGWLATRLSGGSIGNTSTGVLKISIKIKQLGTFTMDPTFHELWQSWDTVFDRKYIGDLNTAKEIIRQGLTDGWATHRDNMAAGVAALADGAKCTGQVTALLKKNGTSIAAVPHPLRPNLGPGIMGRLGVTWKSDD